MKKIILIALILILFSGNALAEWNVTWTPVKESIIDKEYIITVQNMQNVKRDVNISSFFAETNFNISSVSDVQFYEWKDIPYTYTVDHYDEVEHSEYQVDNDTWYYWIEQVYNWTETMESVKLDWKLCKSQLFKETSTTKEDNYGFINIPAYGSKPKDDGTYNGTKILKLTFRTPVVYDGTYGSYGKVALLLDGEEHHPYWNTSWSHKQEIILTGGASGVQTDYQLLLNISWVTGMQADFDDLRFCNNTHEIDAWLESKINSSYVLVWVEFPTTPANGVNQNYKLYYGNELAASDWDMGATFPSFSDDFEDGSVADWTGAMTTFEANTTQAKHGSYSLKTQSDTWQYGYKSFTSINYPIAVDFWIYFPSNTHTRQFGLASATISDRTNSVYAFCAATGIFQSYDGTTTPAWGLSYNANQWYHVRIVAYPATDTFDAYVDNMVTPLQTGLVTWGTFGGTIQSFYVRNENSAQYYDTLFIHKYAANPPTYEFGSTQHFAGSIHYNASSPYNHTIESDDIITVNRTIIASDDINWTASALTDDCQFLVTEYNYTNFTLANFTIYSNTLNWLQITNLTPTDLYKLRYTNGTEINATNADANGTINYTEDFTPNNYQIVVGDTSITISLHSKDPSCLYTNYTGFLTASYIVESYYPLNYSSLSFLMGMNYTLTNDYHSWLKAPANDIASEGIYRAHNRNTTPYMPWESNNTITEGNVWKWAGGTIDDHWIQNETINDTHTWINVSGVASNVYPSMFYLGRQAQYEAPKTGIEINKHQGIIFKIWDIEQLRSRNYNYYLSLYFDSQIEATPDGNIEIWYCNDSFNPITDDPCLVCDYKDTWTSGRWLDHEKWQPQGNVSFAKPLQVHAGTAACVSSPTEVNYIYLKSDTVTSKSYILNATNTDPGICNRTFAQTGSMWLRDEVAGTNTAYAYTPSFYITFVRNYLEFTHHLYIANDQDVWGHSGYATVPIGVSNVNPTFCRYNYFWWNGTQDYNMTGSYEESFWINLTYGYDPDNGAALTHVLSLYDDNYNFIAFINSSLVGNCTNADIFFDITDYKVTNRKFKLKIISTDNEGTTSTAWSNTFELLSDNRFYKTIKILEQFPTVLSNTLSTFISYLPLFIGILIAGTLIFVTVGIFSKFKRW